MNFVVVIRAKIETYTVLKKFRVLVDKQCDRNLEIRRTYVGDKHTSKEFKAYCESNEI